MNQIRRMERLRNSGILAQWECSQQSWDEIARAYNKCFSWRVALAQLMPIILVSMAASVGSIFYKRNSKQVASQLTFFDGILIFVICIFLLMVVYWIMRWLNTEYIPKPKVGHKPIVIISNAGILLGNRFFFFERGVNINKIVLDKFYGPGNHHVIQIGVTFASVTNEIILPVPDNKLSEAKQVVSTLTNKFTKI